MSTSSSSEEEPEEVIAEPVAIKEVKPIPIFINYVDTYQGQAIVDVLPTTPGKSPFYEIRGTVKDPGFEDIKGKIAIIMKPTDPQFMNMMLENHIIIYDIGIDTSQVDQAERVLDALEKYCHSITGDESKKDIVKYFILISTPLTWAKTPAIEENSEFLLEAHYRKRRNHPCFVRHKCLEREVVNFQKRCKPHIRTLVLCPGATYGGANDIFHYIFKLAFYNKDIIPLFKSGNNFVPLLYIKDFGKMVKQIMEKFPGPEHPYILAVQPRLINMKTLTRNIAFNIVGNVIKINHVAAEEVLKTYEELIPARVFHAITMDIKMAPTYFSDFPFELEDVYEEFGAILADEYRKARKLLPIRIVIDGPPMVGKTTLAKCIADYYVLHYLETEKIMEFNIKYLLSEIEETKAFLDVLEEERNEAMQEDNEDQTVVDDVMDMEDRLKELILEWMNELEELNAFVEEQKQRTLMGEPKVDDFEFKKKCILKMISSKAYNDNQGYVLDGFPFEYAKAGEIYPTIDKFSVEGEEEGGRGQTTVLKPDYVILLDAPDELLCKRAAALPEQVACTTRNTEDQFLERLEQYRDRNEEDKSLQTFFYDMDVIPMNFFINENTKCEEIFEKIKEKIGPPHIYPISKFEKEALERWKEQMRIKHEMEMKRIREDAIAKEREQREANLQKWTKEFERLKCKEQEYLEAKSLPLRQYLAKFVLPPLTEGLLKVAEVMPEDPVDFLAEHLFQCNPHGHVLDPSYSEEIKRLLLDEGDEDIAKTLDMMAENENAFANSCNPTKDAKEQYPDDSSTAPAETKHKEVQPSNIVKILRDGLKSEE